MIASVETWVKEMLRVYWGELSSHISCHHQPLQLFLKLTYSSKSWCGALKQNQVFNLLKTIQGLKPGWAFHTPPQWPEQCIAFGMPHSTRAHHQSWGNQLCKMAAATHRNSPWKGSSSTGINLASTRGCKHSNQRVRINGAGMETSTVHSWQFPSIHWVVLDVSLKLFLPCLIRKREEQWPFSAVASFDPRLECTSAAFC